MAQQAVENVGWDKHNFARTGRMALYGGCVFGPAATTWFSFLARRINFPGRPNLTIAARVLPDQLIFASTNLFCFLSSMAIMEGRDPKEKLEGAYWEALKKNWMLWPLVQAINFRFVPVQGQVLVVNIVSLGKCSTYFPMAAVLLVKLSDQEEGTWLMYWCIGWNCYLSYLNSQTK